MYGTEDPHHRGQCPGVRYGVANRAGELCWYFSLHNGPAMFVDRYEHTKPEQMRAAVVAANPGCIVYREER